MVNRVKDFTGRKGGGGGSAPTPTNTPDNLRSKDTIEVVLGISEGPIEGLRNGAKDFFIGDTALQNETGEFNFKTFVLNFFPGTDVASPVVPILGGQSSNTAVSLALSHDTPVTRTTTTRNIDIIEIRLVWNALYVSNTSGTFNADAVFRIEYKKTADSTWIKAYDQDILITGKTTSAYPKEIRIILPEKTNDDDWDIRITKVSEDSTGEYINEMTWESFQEIIQGSKAYNNTAVLQLSGEASDQFSSIPAWSGIYKGLLVQVPSNYDPITRIYTGAWDGTWQIAWTNNPAWVLYDFVMNDRYGIRSYYPSVNLDRYDVYDAAVWCDELVPDGAGGFQPRYTFNALLSEARSGKELARYIAGSINATFFDDLNGKAFLRVDKDDPAVAIFTKENIYDEGFEYSYTDITTRFNDISVTYINPLLNWAEDRRRVFDQDLIDKNGRIPFDYIAVGCTDTHEALRRSWYRLITSNTETCLVNFKTNRFGSLVKPFDVILICDPDMGYGVSGRVKTWNDDFDIATLRTPIYLEAGVQYYATFTLDNGNREKIEIIDFAPGYNTELKLIGAVSSNVPDRGFFTLEAEGVIGLPRPFRVTKVEEVGGNSDGFVIEGININRNKWFDADNITDSGEIDYSSLPDPFDPPGPTSCTFDERFVKSKKQFHIIVNPTFDRGAYKYYSNDHSFEVWSRLHGTTDAFVIQPLYYGDTLINHPPGIYDFKILGRSVLGKTTRLEAAPTYTFAVTNPLDPPADIDWFRLNKREYYWGYINVPDDFDGFELRYQNQEANTNWDSAIRAHEGVLTQTSFYTQLIPPSARVVMIKAKDVFGVYSVNPQIIFKDAETTIAVNEVYSIDYHPLWLGDKTGCEVDDTYTNLLLHSEEFDNAYWSKTGSTITPNAAVSPSSTTTMDKLVETTSSTSHAISRNITGTVAQPWTFSAYGKAGEKDRIMLTIRDAGATTNAVSVIFDLTLGTILTNGITGSGSYIGASIEDVGGGIYRCSVSGVPNISGTSVGAVIYLKDNTSITSNSYTGNGTDGAYIWGAQLVTGSRKRDYLSTTTATVTHSGSGYLRAFDTGVHFYSGVGTAFIYDGGDMYTATYNSMTYEDEFTVPSGGDMIIDIDFEGSGYQAYYKLQTESIWLPVIFRQTMEPGDYDIRVSILGGPIRGILKTLSIIIDSPDIIEDIQDLEITVGSAGLRLPITIPYSTIKNVFIAIQAPGTAVGYRIIDKDPILGPLVKLVDITDTFVTGSFDATIKGFI